MTDDLPDEPAQPAEEPTRKPAPLPLPAAKPGASPATQVATVAVVVVVLLVLGVVFLLQGGDGDQPRVAPTSEAAPTTVPDVPSSGFQPSADSSLAAPPLDIPASLCPKDLTLEHPFTVLSFNIHSAIRKQGGLAAGTLIKEIGAWKPDVVLLQEVDNNRGRSGNVIQAQQIADALGMSWVAGSGQTGNAVLSRFPVKAHDVIALPQAGGKFPRHAVHAVVDVEGTDVSVYSTHFDHMSQGARIAQARALARVVAADARPTVVAGDLNSRVSSTAVSTLRSAGLGDVWAVGTGSGNTAPAGSPRVRIDFILHDAFLEPLQSVVLASSVSDHRAVWSRLQLSETIGCLDIGLG
ncbi:MAG TPA: endonuclease/exonuclease/phosphatase family protein [Nocardioides sp.]|nr:endonuclease/exonuclease/phosphatase family protein [Nocardioides sp.]